MSKPFYQRFDMPEGLADDVLSALEVASETPGAIRKGTNETTKAIERGEALLVYIALDVDPPEIVAHLPLLCEEKKIPYCYVPSKKSIGRAVGIGIDAAGAAIVNAGEAGKKIEQLSARLRELAGM
jgi:large subunit ribosomal protein L7Ae